MKTASRAAKDAARAVSPRRTRTPRRSRDGESPSGSQQTERRASRRRTRSARAEEELPDADLTDEQFLTSWGIPKEEEERRLVEFRKIIEGEVGPLKPMFDKYYLRRFLRARQHDLPRARDMFLAHLRWRADYGTDTILQDFTFPERDAFLTLYPQGYHKTDRLGRPIYIQHLGQINMKALNVVTNEERMLRYHVQEYERALRYIFPACSLVAGRHVSQTLAVMDLKGVGLRHLSGEVKRVLSAITRTDQDNYPETLGKTLIINAPGVFRAIWAVVKPMLDARTQAKIEVCPADYLKVLTKWVDPDNIPAYLGGRSQGALIDDVGPWDDPAMVARIEEDIRRRESGGAGEAPLLGADSSGSISLLRVAGDSAAAEPLLPSAQARGGRGESGGSGVEGDSGVDGDVSEDDFHDALTRRLSSMSSASSAYMSADEDLSDSSGAAGRAAGLQGGVAASSVNGTPASSPEPARPAPLLIPDGGASSVATPAASPDAGAAWAAKPGHPSPAQQVPILARVRALEERLPAVEAHLRPQLPRGEAPPSAGVGQGTLLARVAALERAMEVVVRAQEAAMDEQQDTRRSRRGCCGACSIM